MNSSLRAYIWLKCMDSTSKSRIYADFWTGNYFTIYKFTFCDDFWRVSWLDSRRNQGLWIDKLFESHKNQESMTLSLDLHVLLMKANRIWINVSRCRAKEVRYPRKTSPSSRRGRITILRLCSTVNKKPKTYLVLSFSIPLHTCTRYVYAVFRVFLLKRLFPCACFNWTESTSYNEIKLNPAEYIYSM